MSGDACDSWHRWRRGPRPRRRPRAQRPTASRSSGLASSRSPGSSRSPRSTTTDASSRAAASAASSRQSRCTTSRCRGGWRSGAASSPPRCRPDSASTPARSRLRSATSSGIACTINEPNIVALMGYLLGAFPPKVRDRARFEAVSATMRASHHAMVEALRAGPGLVPGRPHALDGRDGGGRGRRGAARHGASSTWRTPTCATCAATTSSACSATRGCASDPTGPSTSPRASRRTKMGYEYRPEAVEHTVRRAAAVCGLPVVVTEIGISTDDDARAHRVHRRASLGGVSSCLATASTSGASSTGRCSTTSSGPSATPSRSGSSQCDRDDLRATPEAVGDTPRRARRVSASLIRPRSSAAR